MKKLFLSVCSVFLLFSLLFSQSISVHPGWNFFGAQENQITMNQFAKPGIVGLMKYIGNGSSFDLTPENWAVWAQDEDLMSWLEDFGFEKLETIYQGENFVLYGDENINLKFEVSGYCPGNFLPVGTVSSDWKNGNYAIINIKNWNVNKNLSPVSLGGDIRIYIYSDYIFVVDAPSFGDSSTWYVYKIDPNANSLDLTNLAQPLANYNIPGANPQGFALKNEKTAYLTNFQGNEIIIFNPLTGEIIGNIDLTPYLYNNNQYISAYNMLIYKNKLFITAKRKYVGWSNSDPETPDYSYIIVIDLNNNSVIKTISVKYDPLDPQVYNGYLYFLSKGDYGSPIGEIYRINLTTLEVDDNFKISSPQNPDNESQTDYIKNFVITNEGEMFIVANNGIYGDPYHIFRILNVELYDDNNKTGLIPTPVYSAGFIKDIDYVCGYIVIADRNQDDSKSYLVFLDKNGNIVKKISTTDLGYQPFMIGTNYFYF